MCQSHFSVRERHLYVHFSPKVKLVRVAMSAIGPKQT